LYGTSRHDGCSPDLIAPRAVITESEPTNEYHAQAIDSTSEHFIEPKAPKEVSVSRQTISNYVNLIKPHVTILLLGITVATMAIARKGLPDLGLVVATLLGGAMAAGSANCLNCYLDRDMTRSWAVPRGVPYPQEEYKPTHALIFGIVLA